MPCVTLERLQGAEALIVGLARRGGRLRGDAPRGSASESILHSRILTVYPDAPRLPSTPGAFWRVNASAVVLACSRAVKESMSSETMYQIVEIIEAEVRSRPSAIEF